MGDSKVIDFINVTCLQDEIFSRGLVEYVFLKIRPTSLQIDAGCFERMIAVARDLDAAMVYSGYRTQHNDGRLEQVPGLEYQPGSVRDDFDFGALVCVNVGDVLAAISCIGERASQHMDGGWYALRLALSESRMIGMIPEILYTEHQWDQRHSGEKQHDYVNPRARGYQKCMEDVFLAYLNRMGALTLKKKIRMDYERDMKQYPVEMSVVIPVKNRKSTIMDAVDSALQQQFHLPYNVIVVDNCSDDGTRELLETVDNPRFCLIKAESDEHLGIGGCWNKAIFSESCGRFAIQLDSDDIYSSPDTLMQVWQKFRSSGGAAVVGSYVMTDFDKNPIPPGLISHDEWTDRHGADNALRINGFGAPRAYCTEVLRQHPFPNVSYGEDYAVMLRISREYVIGRIYDPLYLCRRWNGNSDAHLSTQKVNEHNFYKDFLRSYELMARIEENRKRKARAHDFPF